MLRITENLVGDISSSIVLDFNFFFVYFISIRKGIYKPSTMSQVLLWEYVNTAKIPYY